MINLRTIDEKQAKSNFKYMAILKNNLYTYKTKKDLRHDLNLKGFREDVIKILKVKEVWVP